MEFITMPVPKRKRSRARRDKRFANKGLAIKAFTVCSNCSEPLATHQACLKCGFFKGQKVMKTKLDRGIKRQETKKMQQSKKVVESEQSE